MAEDIRLEVKMESMAIFIYLGVYLDWVGEEWGNHKPLMSLASSPFPAPAVDRAHSVAECQKKGPRNEMSGWSTLWVNPSLLEVLRALAF